MRLTASGDEAGISDLFLRSEPQMARISPFFPRWLAMEGCVEGLRPAQDIVQRFIRRSRLGGVACRIVCHLACRAAFLEML
jgi:hypothetical protein